jgi:hypothetical protein
LENECSISISSNHTNESEENGDEDWMYTHSYLYNYNQLNQLIKREYVSVGYFDSNNTWIPYDYNTFTEYMYEKGRGNANLTDYFPDDKLFMTPAYNKKSNEKSPFGIVVSDNYLEDRIISNRLGT